ncbi:phosphonoacetate hydrolase [Reichenbachiella faecimaris]|uniref:Phosphonoacetate hydrolase n=1 Tax=Reichenbachiella faecimaris TaxID=692418 RepID=A0A1W2GJM6_REIFA|nr:alkylphosphonate utilization protein [Reichenbachiella faecimaris]SMD36860.1 phosphonoacetate hydrolase [Reichenbachiella faecimaris]
MSIEKELQQRSESKCELCTSPDELLVYTVAPKPGDSSDQCTYLCVTCQTQIDYPDQTDTNHWRCLNDSMWNTNPAVQVLAWRMLNRLRAEGWPQDLLDMLYLDDDTLAWARATDQGENEADKIVHKDSNGAILTAGDSVVLIKDLNVKGANFIAKRGTAVRNITLTHDNPEHIEGKVNGQHIIILTKFVKK